MLLQLEEDLEDMIVAVLAANPPMSVKRIQEEVASRGGEFSAQSIYKHLNKLEENQVVTKLKTLYTLNMAWVVNLCKFAETLEAKLRTQFFTNAHIPRPGEKKSWTFQSAWVAHEFYMHLALTLMCHCKEEYFLTWYGAPWFELVHRTKKSNLWSAVKATGKHFYSLVGLDCPLTRLVLQSRPQGFYHPSFAPDISEMDPTLMITAFDDFLLGIELTQKLFNRLRDFFRAFDGKAGLDRNKVIRLFQEPTKVKVTLEHNPRRANKIKTLIKSNHDMLRDVEDKL